MLTVKEITKNFLLYKIEKLFFQDKFKTVWIE